MQRQPERDWLALRHRPVAVLSPYPQGAPIAGRGVNPTLLGTVTRADLPGLGPVRQVTYAGLPLYRFFLDERPGETEGANLFDPVTSPTGIWYLVQPSRGWPGTRSSAAAA